MSLVEKAAGIFERYRTRFEPETVVDTTEDLEAYRSERRADIIDRRQFVNTRAYADVKRQIQAQINDVKPEAGMDASSCFWIQRGLRAAMLYLEEMEVVAREDPDA